MKFLVDTNVISEIRRLDRANPNVADWVERTPPEDICTSVLVLSELRLGIELKRRHDPAQALTLDQWYSKLRRRLKERILPVSEPIAIAWAHMSVPDRLPFVDGMLAATAIVHNLVLVTRNRADVARTGVVMLDPFEA